MNPPRSLTVVHSISVAGQQLLVHTDVVVGQPTFVGRRLKDAPPMVAFQQKDLSLRVIQKDAKTVGEAKAGRFAVPGPSPVGSNGSDAAVDPYSMGKGGIHF